MGVRARQFLKGLTRGSDKTFEEQMWNFDVLGIRAARNGAARAARRAEVVAVAVSGQLELPGTIRAWLDMCLWLLEDEKPTLIALFGSSSAPNIAPIRAHLSCIARRARIKFSLAHRQVSLSPVVGVVGPNEYQIWPKSVEQDLLSWLELRDAAAKLARAAA